MNDLVPVIGTNECFCDATIVLGLWINDAERIKYPRGNEFRWLMYLDDRIPKKSIREQKKKLRELSFCMNNLYNQVESIYGQKRYAWCKGKHLAEYFIQVLDLFLYCVPTKYLVYENYYLTEIPHGADSVHCKIVHIKPQGIAWFEQEFPKMGIKGVDYKKFCEIIKSLNSMTDKSVDFDEYIDDWAKRLLRGES